MFVWDQDYSSSSGLQIELDDVDKFYFTFDHRRDGMVMYQLEKGVRQASNVEPSE